MKKFAAILVMGAVMVGCSAVLANSDKLKGLECLDNKDPDGAIMHFTKACETCSYDWNNLNGLSAAYGMKGDLDKAWKYSHKACYIGYKDYAVHTTFMSIFEKYIIPKYKLQLPGSTREEILTKLGEPDKMEDDKLTYGCLIFCFEDNKVVQVVEMYSLK